MLPYIRPLGAAPVMQSSPTKMEYQTLRIAFLLFLFITASTAAVPRLIQLPVPLETPEVDESERLDIHYHNCQSWRLGVEAHNIINFKNVPTNCESDNEQYMGSGQYTADSKTVCKEAYFFAKGLALKNDTINVFIFDIDETLLSNAPFFQEHKYGVEPINRTLFLEWISLGVNPVLGETRHLYYNLIELGIKPIIITERYDSLAGITIQNLKDAGYYEDWEMIIFRANDDRRTIRNFKYAARRQVRKSGYNVIGTIGDQWSDLERGETGRRTFKLPNPFYYVN